MDLDIVMENYILQVSKLDQNLDVSIGKVEKMTFVEDYYKKHPEAAKRLKTFGEKNKEELKKKKVVKDVQN